MKPRYHVVVKKRLLSVEKNIDLHHLCMKLESSVFDDLGKHHVRIFRHTDSNDNGTLVAESKRNEYTFTILEDA